MSNKDLHDYIFIMTKTLRNKKSEKETNFNFNYV